MPNPSRIALTAIVLLALAALPAAALPPDSDGAAAQNGGGCYPTGISPGVLDLLRLVDPEWAPVTSGMTVDSTPIYFHGTVDTFHGDTGGDFPATHVTSDAVFDVTLDPADADLAGTGNSPGMLGVEWEHGSLQPFAWPGEGDRFVALGRWIFDCGHPDATPGNCSMSTAPCILDSDCGSGETCDGEHFGYESELHPPQALAVFRTGRGGLIRRDLTQPPAPATRTDIFVSADGGGAGDRCILTHQDNPISLLGTYCFPLAEPVAPINGQDFIFDLPLPPRPDGAHAVSRRLVTYPTPGGGPQAKVRVRKILLDPDPHLEVTVRMTRTVGGVLPTGFAGTIFAGWRRNETPLTHVRVTVQAIDVNNPLKPVVPIAPKTCSKTGDSCSTDSDCTDADRPSCTYLGGTSKVCQRPCGVDSDCQPPTCASCGMSDTCLGQGPVTDWAMQAAVNGEWQRLTGLGNVTAPGSIGQSLVYDQYLPAGGQVRIQGHGVSKECVDTMLGKSLGTDLNQYGFTRGLDCLTSRGHNSFGGSSSHAPGRIDETYPGPDFGAGMTGSMDYAVTSTGGDAGHCSLTTSMLCVYDEDCPSMESCTIVGGAYDLQYRIELVP